MAKRFTDNEKWQDDWFFNLDQCGKLSWIYILDHCDHAGLWKKNIKLLNFNTGCDFVEEELKQLFYKRIVEIEDRWFIPKFITFQYGTNFASSKQKPVQSAIELLRRFNLISTNDKGIVTLSIPNVNPNLTLMDKEMDMVMDKDVDTIMNKEMIMNKDVDTIMNKEKLMEWEMVELMRSINENIPNENLRTILINLIQNVSLTTNQRDKILSHQEELINKIPKLKIFF
jgi:hypothetical protein